MGVGLGVILVALVLAAACGRQDRPHRRDVEPSGELATLQTTGPSDLEPLATDLECPGCSVLLLTIDTVRADFLPCYGFPKETAPEMCAFGDENLLFEHAYSPAPSTFPSLRSILSGSIVANEDLGEILAHFEQQRYLGELLAEAGYRTAMFTDHRGFGTSKRVARPAAPMLRGFETFENFGEGEFGRGSTPVTAALLTWLSDNGSEPFFAWAHYFDPHFAYMPPAELEGRFGFDAATCGRVSNGMDIEEIRDLQDDLTEREVECLADLHQAEVFFTDRHLGQVFDFLEASGLADETLVILTADHGEEFMERSRIGHERTVYDELVHVPFMIRNPRHPARRRVQQPVSTSVVRDAVLDAVLGRPVDLEAPVVTRTYHYYGKIGDDPSKARTFPNDFAMVQGHMKAVVNPDEEKRQLFDLEADPGERNDLSALAGAVRFFSPLEEWLRENLVEPGAPSREALEEFDETTERLKALGYVR